MTGLLGLRGVMCSVDILAVDDNAEVMLFQVSRGIIPAVTKPRGWKTPGYQVGI